jgi:hypothetical protein
MEYQKMAKIGMAAIVMAVFTACGPTKNKEEKQQKQEQAGGNEQGRDNQQGPGNNQDRGNQQGGDKRPTTAELFEKMDSNKDGKLAESEVDGPLKNDFSKIDSNSDGYLTKKELDNGPKPQGKPSQDDQKQGNQAQGGPPQGGKQMPSIEEVLAKSKNNENTLAVSSKNYVLPTTGQVKTYDAVGKVITDLQSGDAFYGQDGNYQKGQKMSYTDNGDGTVTDNVTGLMWAQDQSTEAKDWEETAEYCKKLTLGGHTDWRMPTIKELWSIRNQSTGWPYIDTNYFHLVSKDGGEQRDQHTWSSNYYLVNTENAKKRLAFIVNDWTGHIKALDGRRYVRAVRGGLYGVNQFVDNGDKTITDKATGLMWSKEDSKKGMNWEAALAYAEGAEYAGYSDWRLPNVKELQSIVDYSGVFPAIDTSFFTISSITNEAGNADYPYFWTSTSAGSERVSGVYFADYVAFGYAVDHEGKDIHGAGAVRFDTKIKDGPAVQNEERINNYVRLVRDAK